MALTFPSKNHYPLPFKGVILTDGQDESFIRTLYHNEYKTRIWRCTKLFSSNLEG